MRRFQEKKLTITSVLLVAFCLVNGLLCPAGGAEDERANVAGSVGLVFNSKYIWRGQNLVDGPVLQPEGSLSYGGWTGTVWANYDLDEGDEWTELDYTLDYTTTLESLSSSLAILSVSVGYTYYTFPPLSHHPEVDVHDDSHEVYAGLSLETLLSPYLTVYYDFEQGDGMYYEIGIGHGFSLGGAELSLGGSVGYNDGQWGYDSSFSAALLLVALDIPLTEWLTWSSWAAGSLALDNQYANEFFGGTGIAFSF